MDEKIKDYLKNPKKEYKVFNLELTKKEKEVFKSFKLPKLDLIKKNNLEFKVAQALGYHFCGNPKDITDLKDFLNVLGDNSPEHIEILENKIREIAKKVLSGYEEKYCWLNIRITYKDPFFNIPRWHYDGKLFNSRANDKSESSFVMALQGPGTLLIKDTSKVIDKFNEIQKSIKPIKIDNPEWQKESMRIRKLINKEFKNEEITQLKNTQGCIFYAYPGTKYKFKYGAIHSEPKKDTFRMFIKIEAGSKKEINEFSEKYLSLFKNEKDEWQNFKYN